VTGTSTKSTTLAEREIGEAEVDGVPARLLLLEAIGVGPGERTDQRALAVVDVTGGPMTT